MSNSFRKIKRNNLKTNLGNNKINNLFHSQNDSLAKRLYNRNKKCTKTR